ncbi:SREBP regulating gene protein [Hetaerina americana]|uniref:SREBP regulating gene protein n=1 Tax=Hetaerina americana TaxID=62018 RepID=UPI003A7F16E8
MWAAFLMRVIRKKVVLGFIFGISLTYCILSIVTDNGETSLSDMEIAPVRKHDQPFLWHSGKEENLTSIKVTTCRNSVQGKVLIVDDRGYICSRSDVLANGCCNNESDNTKRYACDTCRENGCCSIYEYCISCCLDPNKKTILQGVLGKASETFNVLFASVTDHFELCLAKCRTSSQSVLHENSYRDPRAKHCYGETPPVAAGAQPAPPDNIE